MDTSAMVKKIAILATGIIVALLIIATLRLTRRGKCNEYRESTFAATIETPLEHKEEPLTGEEVEECFRAFEEICNAYSNLQFEVMQEMFCGISNKVARLGKDRLDKAVETLLKSFRERFRYADINALDFSDVLEFDRFIRTNVTASNIIGCSMVANGIYDSHLREYDMVVFNQISASVKTFEEKKDDKLATAAQSLLDEWKEHLASGQSVTRMLLRLELKWCLGWPRWLAEDFGIKSESDWIAYMRDYALKFHKQCYGVVPKWIDEEFPLPKNGEDIETNPEKAQ